MPRARANGIELEYETFGADDAQAVVLISGLGSQMISWRDEFCTRLAARGFRVIRFDNRDAGHSTWMDEAGRSGLAAALSGTSQPAYQLDDLAADAVGLLDAIGIPAANIVGASMGGYIAQLVAINHPARVLSLTSIMSGPGVDEAIPPTAEAAAILIAGPPSSREGRIEQAMHNRSVLRGSADPFDPEFERARATAAVDRAYNPAGTERQLVAVLASRGRLERLKGVHAPTLVIHGNDDILIPVENGRLVAAAIPGARLLELEGMGHDLPKRVWPQVIDAIEQVAHQAVPQPR